MTSPTFSDILEFHKPHLIMYDNNFEWYMEMAMSRNIPSVHFQIMGATANAYFFFVCSRFNSILHPFFLRTMR